MADQKSNPSDPAAQRRRALSGWENEGGGAPVQGASAPDAAHPIPELTNAELVQLRVRVIALENLLISLLAEAPDRQLDLVREMAAYISPRPGVTLHPLTVHAAGRMVDLVERAGRFRDAKL